MIVLHMRADIVDIIGRCQKHDRAAQRQLFELFYSEGLSIALRYTRNEADAKEILSNAFIRAFKNISSFDLNYPFNPWFRRIIIHAVSDYYRYSKEPFLEIEYAKTASVENNSIDNLSHDEIMRLIQKLPHAYRICFNLYVVDGYKHQEIAEMLQIKEGTSKSNVAMAKKKLQVMIQEENKIKQAK